MHINNIEYRSSNIEKKKKSEKRNKKPYDLEERVYEFAKNCRVFVRQVQSSIGNREDTKQLIRSSGSVAANYIEANEAVSKKDKLHRLKISKKEAKESILWLRLIYTKDSYENNNMRLKLQQEAKELMNILGAIIQKIQ